MKLFIKLNESMAPGKLHFRATSDPNSEQDFYFYRKL